MRVGKSYDPDCTPLDGTMLLEASAGTGKTYALERMAARLIGRSDRPVDIQRILAVTFTNRAAGEMKERIRTLLTLRAQDRQCDPDERMRYRTALFGFDGASIYTIHGFCQMVLSTWPFESAAPFRPELDPGGKLELSEARRWLAGISDRDMDPQLLKAAYQAAGSIEALAASIAREITRDDIPPGSKVLPTQFESEEFASLLSSSRRSESPLSQAAENLLSKDWSDAELKAAVKMAVGKSKRRDSLAKIRAHMKACRGRTGLLELSESLFGDPSGEGATTHFLELLAVGFPGEDETEAAELIAAVRALVGEMKPYVERISNPKKPVVSLVERYMRCSFYDIASCEVGKRVKELKDAGGAWTYSDLIRRVSDALEKPNSPLLSLLRRRYDAALIDEFQDTDPRQWNLFHSLFGGPNHLLVLIGDPKQNIYGFRGTGLQAYRAASSAIDEERVYRLDTNYRSCPLLVEAGNVLFRPLFRRSVRGGTPVGYSSVSSGKTDSDVFLWNGGEIPVEFVSLSGDGRPGDLAAAAYVSEIRRILDSRHGAGWRGASGEIRPVSPSDIAVLVRRNRDEEDILARLADVGIPAIRYRSRTVFAQPAAALLRDLIRAMDRPRAVSEWKGVLLGGLFKLPPNLVYRFENEGRLDAFIEEGLEWRGTFLEGRAVEALEAFFQFAPEVGRWAAEAGRSDIGKFLERPWPIRIVAEPGGIRTWQDWRHLTELIQKKQAEGVGEPGAILTWLTESANKTDIDDPEEAVRLETESPAVRVMTMHAAKGLEFPLVFLHGGFEGGSFRRDRGDFRFDDEGTLIVDRILRDENRPAHLADEWEEDKRLWYVSFTRASVKVWLPKPANGPVLQIESLLAEVLDEEPDRPHLDGIELPPHLSLAQKQADNFREKLTVDLTGLISKHASLFRIAVGDLSLLPPQPVPLGPAPTAASLPNDIPSDRDPVTSSYTSLVRGAAVEADDRDLDGSFALMPLSESVKEDEIDEPLPLASDRGALFGTLIHAVLEECDFALARDLSRRDWLADHRVEELFSSLSRRYYPPDWYRSRGDALKLLVRSTLRSTVPGVGRLCDIELQNRRAEVEFLISVPQEARLALEETGMEETGNIRISGGFLKGFIDLLFKVHGRWWVADWKTNVPPGVFSADSYDEGVLRETMESHHYHFQYELYLLSLCRTLSASSGRAVNWDEDIGGAAYLFVRGMRENDERGVLVAKPKKRRMMEMAEAMGLKGVLV